MDARARAGRQHRPVMSRVVSAWLLGLLVVACGDQTATTELTGRVQIIVDLDDVHDVERWEARGPLVDGGDFCPSGRRHLLAVFDPDTGAQLSVQKFIRLFDDLASPVDRPDILAQQEHVCDDGSGAFVAAENQHRGTWEIRSGTGRYSGVSGTGSASFVVDLLAKPSELYIVAELGATDARSGEIIGGPPDSSPNRAEVARSQP